MMIHDETCPKCDAVYNPINGPHVCIQEFPKFYPDAFAMIFPALGQEPVPAAEDPEPAKKSRGKKGKE